MNVAPVWLLWRHPTYDLWMITSPVFFLFLREYLLGLYSHFTESTQCPLGECLCGLRGKVHRQKQISALETGMESLADEVYQGWLRSRRVWSPEGFWHFGRTSVMSWVGTRMHCLKTPGKAAALPGSQHALQRGPLLFFCALHCSFAKLDACCLLPMLLTALLVMPDLPEVWARDSGWPMSHSWAFLRTEMSSSMGLCPMKGEHSPPQSHWEKEGLFL